MTSETELLAEAKRQATSGRAAFNHRRTFLAVFSNALGRFQAVAGKGIDGKWYEVRHELLIDGKPVCTDADFIETDDTRISASYCQPCVWANHARSEQPQYELLSTYCLEGNCDGCGRYSMLALGKIEKRDNGRRKPKEAQSYGIN